MDIQQLSVRRGDIFYANLTGVTGSEQGGCRPVLIIQNDIGNQHSPTTIVAVITGQRKSRYLPTYVLLGNSCGLAQNSMVMLEQIRTLDKDRLQTYLRRIKPRKMHEIDIALKISVGLQHTYN